MEVGCSDMVWSIEGDSTAPCRRQGESPLYLKTPGQSTVTRAHRNHGNAAGTLRQKAGAVKAPNVSFRKQTRRQHFNRSGLHAYLSIKAFAFRLQ